MEIAETVQISLETLGGGAASEKFDKAFDEVLRNIRDMNNEHKVVREINMKVSLLPSDDRRRAGMAINVSTKLAPQKPFGSMVLIGEDAHGKVLANEVQQPQQMKLFEPQQMVNVTQFQLAKGDKV